MTSDKFIKRWLVVLEDDRAHSTVYVPQVRPTVIFHVQEPARIATFARKKNYYIGEGENPDKKTTELLR